MSAPFAVIPENVVASWPRLSFAAKAVTVAAASFMDARGECFPGREKLMERSGLKDKESVTKGLKELEAADLLEIRRRKRQSSLFRWTAFESRKNPLSKNLESGKNPPPTSTTLKKKTAEPPRGTEVSRIRDEHAARYAEATGVRYDVRYGRDGKLLKTLIGAHGPEAVRKRMAAMFRFYGRKRFPFRADDATPPDIPCLWTHWNRFGLEAREAGADGHYKKLTAEDLKV